MSKFHLQATVAYVYESIKARERAGKPQDYVTHEGQPVSFPDAYQSLEDLRAQGVRYVACCDNVDETGRCLGIPDA